MKLYFLLLFVLSSNCFSFEIKKSAVVRDKNFNAVIEEVKLLDLVSEDSYEGKYFKIVNGKSNIAVRFDDDQQLQLKAATAYYHMSKARSYFVDNVKSKYVKDLPVVVVRLDLTNVFNEIGHFANDNLDPQFNNALSVPAGKGYERRKIDPWGIEVWFRPVKEININELKSTMDFSGGLKGPLTSFRNQTHMANFERFITNILYSQAYGGGWDKGSAMRLVGSSILLEAIYQSSDIAAEFFTRKIYRLDSALVPEIIYHEFSHVALSDHLELSHSTAVNEGLADYFAGKISNSKKLATKIKDYNLFSGKEVRNKQQYRKEFEQGSYANTDFVFGLLWNIGETVGTDIEPIFMYGVSSKLSTNVTIKEDLINATLESCKISCKDPMNDRMKLYMYFNSKNL